MHLYNEIEPYAVEWLFNLMLAGEIPPGNTDARPIQELRGHDLRGVKQFHTFAGIGGWPLALRLAGWPEDREVWTGSCPCQPFSVAGRRKGTADERHLWPEFLRLIAECRPATIFGEQVASKDGRLWLAGVRSDLEALGYRVAAADLCAAGVGAPHIRQRLYWVADAVSADVNVGAQTKRQAEFVGGGSSNGMGDAPSEGPLPGAHAGIYSGEKSTRTWHGEPQRPGGGVWRTGADGKTRRIEPGIEPLAHGVSRRMDKLRGYGNAIVPPLAAEFIKAYLETEQ